MEVVTEDFFKRLPVDTVVSSLESSARHNVCQATGINPDLLPNPLLTEKDVQTAVEPLRQAVSAEVTALQKSFQRKLEDERREHREELRKRRRLDSDCRTSSDDDDDDGDYVVGTYDCEEDGHLCGKSYHECEDERVTPYELENMLDSDIIAYAEKYLQKEFEETQKKFDRFHMVVTKGNASLFMIQENLSPDKYTLTPAKKKINDNEQTILQFLKIQKYRFDTVTYNVDCDFYFDGFIGTACPKYKFERTHDIAADPNKYNVKSMLRFIDAGIGFNEFEEYNKFHFRILGSDLARIYATALLLRDDQFSEDDYTRMKKELETSS